MSVAPRVIFDTNSLWNFAVVERLDVVEQRYGQRCGWTETVQDEADFAERYEPKLAMLKHCPWLGAPIQLKGTGCLAAVSTIQRILASPGDPPTRHLGEAESIHIIEHELDGLGIFVSDDNGAIDLASRRGIRVMRTHDVLAECYAMGELVCPEPFDLLTQMADADRAGVRVPDSHQSICP